jgi:WXXGXW repeat (2 copies)
MRLTPLRLARTARWLLLALLVSLIPATSHAGVFISVGFAPPPLVAYEQPVCPEPGLMWTPGYWGYGPDGYYWVPGAWVPAPYEGALWTPGYWGWGTGLYVWHPGYWGPHVGYYGGVNYGFGYMGIGFVGGAWRGGVFAYNSAVMHVGFGGAWGNRVYVDRTIVERNTIVNDRHVAFSGGPGGIRHEPTPEERSFMNERHMGPTSAQTQHMQAAQQNRGAYFNNNHGRPAQVAVSRPMSPANHGYSEAGHNGFEQNRGAQSRPMEQRQQQARPEQRQESRPQARPEQRQESRPQARPEQRQESRPQEHGDSHDHR